MFKEGMKMPQLYPNSQHVIGLLKQNKSKAVYIHSYLHIQYPIGQNILWQGCSYQMVHKQMYWIRTNLRRLQPLNVKCNI